LAKSDLFSLVTDLERTVNFYKKWVRRKRSAQSTLDLVLFSLGGIALALKPRKLLAEDAMVDEVGSGLTLSHLAKSEVEVDAELA